MSEAISRKDKLETANEFGNLEILRYNGGKIQYCGLMKSVTLYNKFGKYLFIFVMISESDYLFTAGHIR